MISPLDGILINPVADFPPATRRYLAARSPRTPYPDADLDFILRLYVETCLVSGVDIELALSQMVHETGALTSEWSQPPRRNPAGIGVTGAVDAAGVPLGQWFATWLDAVQAHIGLLLCYRFPAGEGTDAQKRLIRHYTSFRPSPPRGVGTTVAEMAAVWAADPEYVNRLITVSAVIAKA